MTIKSYDSISSWENLYNAWQRAAKGKRRKFDVACFEHKLESELLALQAELIDQTWRPGEYHQFCIFEPKQRLISAAPFKDRVVHHALCAVTEPRFERSFIYDSYANRKLKGNHSAVRRAVHFAQRYQFVLSLDLVKYFELIDHQILFDSLSKKISDHRTLKLIKLIMASGDNLNRTAQVHKIGDLVDQMRPVGLPIGNLTSQFWANVYLNPFDHFIKRELRCKAYVRYVDDMHLFANDKKTLWQWKEAAGHFLLQLRLRCHKGAHPKPTSEGFGFLGFNIYPNKIRLKNRKGIQYQRHLKSLLARYTNNELEAKSVVDSILSWNCHLEYANTVGLRKKMFSALPEEISENAKVRYLKQLARRYKTGSSE